MSYSNIKLLFHGRKTLWTLIRLRRLPIIMFEKSLSDAHADYKCSEIYRVMILLSC